jgi:hypothetical protein
LLRRLLLRLMVMMLLLMKLMLMVMKILWELLLLLLPNRHRRCPPSLSAATATSPKTTFVASARFARKGGSQGWIWERLVPNFL